MCAASGHSIHRTPLTRASMCYDTLIMIRSISIRFLCVLGVTTIPSVALAATGGGFNNPLNGIDSIGGFVKALLGAVLYILYPLAVLALLYSGFMFVSARGNTDTLKTAKTNFFWTIVGVTLLLGAWALTELLKGTIDPLLRS